MHSWNGNFILDFFFLTRTYRQIPILVFICLLIVASVKRRLVTEFGELYAITFAILLFSFVFPRPNVYYSAYFFVFIALITSVVVVKYKKANLFIVIFLLFVLLQYCYIYNKNSYFDMNRFTMSMEQEVPNSCSTLVGPFNAWFAFKDRQFLGSLPDMFPAVRNILKKRPICYLQRLDSDDTRDLIKNNFAMSPLVKEFDAGGQRYGLYYLRADP